LVGFWARQIGDLRRTRNFLWGIFGDLWNKPQFGPMTDDALSSQPTTAPPGRVFIAGASGMLGRDLVQAFVARGWYVVSPFRDQFDIGHRNHLEALRKGDWGQFDWVINAAAYTQVDQAETHIAKAERANHIGAGLLAFAAQEIGARFVHFSTDFVFDGLSDKPYREDDPTNQLGIYGRSKRHGEEAVLREHPSAIVVRTSWLFGQHGRSFPRTMIEAWRAGKKLRVVADQTGRPTYTPDLAARIVDLVTLAPSPGIIHLAGPDVMTWHQFAVQSIQAFATVTGDSRPVEVEAISTSAWPTPAKRPMYSVLDLAKSESLGLAPMRTMTEALVEFGSLIAKELSVAREPAE
jgi:dTDP-4-dehydrorhamnose reductase